MTPFEVRRMGRPALALALYQTRGGNGRRGIVDMIPLMSTDALAAAYLEHHKPRRRAQHRITARSSLH